MERNDIQDIDPSEQLFAECHAEWVNRPKADPSLRAEYVIGFSVERAYGKLFDRVAHRGVYTRDEAFALALEQDDGYDCSGWYELAAVYDAGKN